MKSEDTSFDKQIKALYGNELDKEIVLLRKEMLQADKEGRDEESQGIYERIREIVSEKGRVVEKMTEDFFDKHGEYPKFFQLDRLSTWILRYMDDRQFETEDRVKWRERRKEFPKKEIYPREHTLGIDGNRRNAPHVASDDPNDYEYILTEYDEARDKRKYNATPVKSSTL